MAIQGNLPGIVALLEQDPNLVSTQVGSLCRWRERKKVMALEP